MRNAGRRVGTTHVVDAFLSHPRRRRIRDDTSSILRTSHAPVRKLFSFDQIRVSVYPVSCIQNAPNLHRRLRHQLSTPLCDPYSVRVP